MSESSFILPIDRLTTTQKVTVYAREILLIIVNIVIATMMVFIFPSQYYTNSNLYIPITLLTGILFTYGYLLTIKVSNERVVSIVHSITFLNIILAAILVDIQFFDLVLLALYYLLTKIMLAQNQKVLRNLESYLYVIYEAAFLGIWYFKDVSTELYLANFLLSQAFIGLIYIQSINELTPSYITLSPLYMNLLSVFLLDKFTVKTENGLFNFIQLLNHSYDYNMLLLVIFIISYIIRSFTSSLELGNSHYILALVMLLQYPVYNGSTGFVEFYSKTAIDIKLDIFNIAFLFVLALMLIESLRSPPENYVIPLSLSSMILFYVAMLFRTTGLMMDAGVIAFAILSLSIFNMKSQNHWIWLFPLQTLLILYFQLANQHYMEWITIALHIGYFIEFAGFSLKFRLNEKFDIYMLFPILVLCIEWFFDFGNGDFRFNAQYSMGLILCYMLLIFRTRDSNRNLGILYPVSLLMLRFSFDSTFTKYDGNFNLMEFGLVIYSLILVISIILTSSDRLDHNVIASQSLLASALIFHDWGSLDHLQYMGILLLIPIAGLKYRITNKPQISNMATHLGTLVLYSITYSENIAFMNSKQLNSILIVLFVVFYYIRLSSDLESQKQFTTVLTGVFGGYALINLFFQPSITERLSAIPYQSILLVLALIPLIIKQQDIEFKKLNHLMVTISYAALYFLPHQVLTRYDDNLRLSFLYIGEELAIDSYSILFLAFIVISSFMVVKTQFDALKDHISIHVYSLLGFLTLLSTNNLQDSNMPILHLVLIQISIYLVFALSSKKMDIHLIASFASLLLIQLIDGTSPNTYLIISDKHFSLTIISFVVTPAVFMILAMSQQSYRLDLQKMAFVFAILIAFAFSSNLFETIIPQELYFLNLFLLTIPVIKSEKHENISQYFMLAGLYEIIFLTLEKTPSMLDWRLFDENFYFITSLLFLLVEIVMTYIITQIDDPNSWHRAFVEFLARIFILFTILRVIDPVTMGIAILIYSLPLVIQSNIVARTYTPLYQAIGIFLISVEPEYQILVGAIPYNEFIFVIWSLGILFIWYSKGIPIQLQSTVTAVFLASLGMVLTSNEFNDISRILFLMIPMIIVLIVGLVFYDRTSSGSQTFALLSVASIMLSTLVNYQNVRANLVGTEEIMVRLIMDWLIFAPLVLEIILYTKPYLDQMYSKPQSAQNADMIIVILLFGFTAISLIMGSESIFVMKLLFIAMGFWILSGIFIRDILAWLVSLYTVFVMGYMLLQMGGEEDAAAAAQGIFTTSYTLYFLGMAFLGVLMLISAVLNEKRYYKEPFTMSLSVTGSILTTVAIIVPAYQNSPFPFASAETSTMIVNFLPNVVWAILGFALFLLASALKKDYMSRLGFGILILDIAKSLYDLFSGVENPLIRIIGSIVLGVICVSIFYLFTKDDKVT